MSACACYWIDLKPEPTRMLNMTCPEHGSVSPPPQLPKVVWPDSPRKTK